jgi:hypothetical protein
MYLQNRSPHRALGRNTTKEAFIGRRTNVGHLHIFGCLNLPHIPYDKKTKLDPTIEKGIIVGYNGVSKVYQVYIPTLRRYVIFEEDRAFLRSCEFRDII